MASSNQAPLPNYEAWREFIIGQCEISLTEAYCHERIEKLSDVSIPATKSFLQKYGDDYRMEVISWFEKANASAA